MPSAQRVASTSEWPLRIAVAQVAFAHMEDDMTEDELVAKEVGVTVEQAKTVRESLEKLRLEKGEQEYRQFIATVSEVVKTAEADGLSPVVLLETMARRPILARRPKSDADVEAFIETSKKSYRGH